MRAILVKLHRYAGLTMAVFLLVSGLTGSVLAFYHELDEWLNPKLFRSSGTGAAIAPLQLAEIIEKQDPRLRVVHLPLRVTPGHSATLGIAPRIDAATGKPYPIGFDELFVDPSTARVLGERQWGACCLEREHLLPFLYTVHYSLYLPGDYGIWLMGCVGLIWVFDCFIGFSLSLPPRVRRCAGSERDDAASITSLGVAGQSFWQRWRPAWRIKRNASTFRIIFDVHRAGGLWFWPLLLVLAMSSVSFNLHEQVFEPIVDLLSPLTASPFDVRAERPPDRPIEPQVSFNDILETALREAQSRRWSEAAESIFYHPLYGLFGVGFGLEHAPGLGNRWLYFDASNGSPVGAYLPGEGTAGDVFHQLQYPLHSGQIAGLPGRILICVTGLAVAVLSITGILIWLRKRR